MVGIVRALLLAIAVASQASCARAQAPDEPVIFHGLTFPASIAGAERISVRDYEKDHPGLGYSVGYRQPGVVSTVYIYDLKKRGIPDDPSAPAIKAEFDAAKGDMMVVLQQGLYSKVEPKEEFWAADAHNRTRLLCGAATVVRSDGPDELASYLCVGGWNGKFIKFGSPERNCRRPRYAGSCRLGWSFSGPCDHSQRKRSVRGRPSCAPIGLLVEPQRLDP